MNLDEFRNQKFEVLICLTGNGRLAAGNEKDFDGLHHWLGNFRRYLGTVNKGKLIVTIYINPLRYTSEYLMKKILSPFLFFDESHKKI